MAGELANLNILITRQVESGLSLAQKIIELGGSAQCLPLFSIEPTLTKKYLAKITSYLARASLIVCVSQNAATLILPYIDFKKSPPWATIGPATATYLQQAGAEALIFPDVAPYNSQTLMSKLKLSALSLAHKDIIILSGSGGDGWLANALRKEGGRVKTFALYKRKIPSISVDQFTSIFCSKPKIDIILITCITSLANLIKLAHNANLTIHHYGLLVVSNRIYKYAREQGFTNVHLAASMSESGILSALLNIGSPNATDHKL